MNPTSRILLILGIVVLLVTPFVCMESLVMIVETDEIEESKVLNIRHYIEEDSIKNKAIIDSLHNDLNSDIDDNTGLYLFVSCIPVLGIGIALIVIGYERHKSAKKRNNHTSNSSHP